MRISRTYIAVSILSVMILTASLAWLLPARLSDPKVQVVPAAFAVTSGSSDDSPLSAPAVRSPSTPFALPGESFTRHLAADSVLRTFGPDRVISDTSDAETSARGNATPSEINQPASDDAFSSSTADGVPVTNSVASTVPPASRLVHAGFESSPQDRRRQAVPSTASDDLSISGYPLFQNYVPDDYGPNLPSQNWAITQDDRGIVYVGNPAGVLAYDGASWRLIPTENQTLVHTVFRDSTGRIYVGAYGEIGYLAPDASGTTRFVSFDKEIPARFRDFGHTWSGVATSSGVYFQTRRAIYRWNGEQMDVWTTSEGARFYKMFSVRDTVYVARENVGLHYFDDGNLRPLPSGERFANTTVTTVLPRGGDELLIGTVASELFILRGTNLERFETQADAFLQSNELYTATVLPDRSYAFATLWGGVVITDHNGRTERVLDKQTGLIGDDVKALYVDRQDGLWMAYESGIARVEVMVPISVFDERTGLDGIALSITRHDGDLHIGTTSGVFRLRRKTGTDGTVRPEFDRVSQLRAQAFALLSHPQGLLVATDRGVFQFRDGGAYSIGESRTAYGLHASRHTDGLIYVGYIDGVGSMRYAEGRWRSLPPVSGLDCGIFFLEEDDRGDLWAASAYGGLWNISTSDGLRNQLSVTQIAEEGQRPQHVFRMAYLDQGGLRVVSRNGVARPQHDETERITLELDTSITHRLPPDAGRVLNLTSAPDGDLWVTAETETYRLHQEENDYNVHVPFAYVPEFSAYSSRAEPGGRFWVVGEEGVVAHRPIPNVRPRAAVQTLIRGVSLIRSDSVLFGGTDVRDAPLAPVERPVDQIPVDRIKDLNTMSAVASSLSDKPSRGRASAETAPSEKGPSEQAPSEQVQTVSLQEPTTVGARGPIPHALAASPDSAQTGRRARQSRSTIDIPYEENALRIQFAAPGFGQEQHVQYQYRLAGLDTYSLTGFDDEWSSWSQETRKEYTNLPPGTYRFEVRARNPRIWMASPASFAFRILPPWYRTVWAYALYALLMGGIVFSAVQLRSQQLAKRAQQLEAVIMRRTAEVKEQTRQLEVYNTELVRSNEVLQETVEEKSKLLGVAAHDLKNPLFGIRALSEVLLERDSIDENVHRKLDLIRSSADETLKLINDLLASAASSAQAQAEMEVIDAGALAEWVVHSFQHQADRKDQRLACSVPSTPCIVEADKRKLREAMNNLISNAIKYSPHGAPILARVNRDGDTVYFSVEDRGPGLSRDDQQRLFAPFQRLTPEPTGDEGSSGLGLYIVKQIAELHDGDVTVETEVGEGSTFTLELPAASSGPRRSFSGNGAGA